MPKDRESKKDPKAVIIRVPEDWHEFLRTRAFNERSSITELIKEALREKYGLKDCSPA